MHRNVGRNYSEAEVEALEDAFVQLAVSTYKEAARLVSTVGEHSAVFA